jgi:hypothetical protein
MPMFRSKVVMAIVPVMIVCLTYFGPAKSQERPAGAAAEGQTGNRSDRRDPNQWRQRVEQFRQQAAERLRTSMGASEEEWKVLQPRIEKVQSLSQQARGGTVGMMGGLLMGFGGRDRTEQANRATTDVDTKTSELTRLLANKDAGVEEIKTALAALRAARAKAKEDLGKAQKELLQIVTVRQEAQLVAMGLLD